MYDVYERFGYSYGEDTPTVYKDVYLAGPFLTADEADRWIEDNDPQAEHNLILQVIDNPNYSH